MLFVFVTVNQGSHSHITLGRGFLNADANVLMYTNVVTNAVTTNVVTTNVVTTQLLSVFSNEVA